MIFIKRKHQDECQELGIKASLVRNNEKTVIKILDFGNRFLFKNYKPKFGNVFKL